MLGCLSTLLPEEMVWSYVSQMVLGLDACHYRGMHSPTTSGSTSPTEDMAIPASAVLHRDLKPENVFLDGNQNIKIGDFGLSKEVAAQSFACTYVGTPYYMSPELATGSHYDIKADIWALGCVAFELCALAPPFDAQDQAELTRKIKLGHIPELPRGYSSDLGNLIRSMLDLNPKRRPTTRHLLREQPIRMACRTVELATMSRKIAVEKTKLRAQYYELEMRERALASRELEVAARQASSSEHEGRLAVLDKREKMVQARERAVLEREQALEQPWDGHDKGQDLTTSKGRAGEETIRERPATSSQHHAGSSGTRRPMARRISSGNVARVRASPSSGGLDPSVAVDTLHVRPVAITTPRALKAEAIRQRFGRVGGGMPAATSTRGRAERSSRRRVDSAGSEEWVDNECETDADASSAESSRGETHNLGQTNGKAETVAPSRRRSSVVAAVEGSQEGGSQSRSARKSITVLPTRAWISELTRGALMDDCEEDTSMRDASAFAPGDDKENQRDCQAAGNDKGQSLPMAGGPPDVGARPSRPALATRTTIAGEPVDGRIEVGHQVPAVYDLSNDEDLPSPFLRKVTRQNNDVLAKRGAKMGSTTATSGGLVGPSNFLARAAAAGAARQSMAAAKETGAPAAGRSSAAPSSARIGIPTSSSALEVTSSSGGISAAAPAPKRRSSALPGSIGVAPLRASGALSSRKSCLPASTPSIRQRAA